MAGLYSPLSKATEVGSFFQVGAGKNRSDDVRRPFLSVLPCTDDVRSLWPLGVPLVKAMLSLLRIPVTARGWHSLTGMFFSLILMFLFVTGTLSVFGHEIDWLTNPAQRVEVAPEGKLTLGATYDAVRLEVPEAQVALIQRVAGPRTADQTIVVMPDGSQRLVLVDPYRGEVQGVGSTRNVWFTLRELHRALSSPSTKVQTAVAAMTLPLAVMLISSLLLYRRFYRGFFRLPRRGARKRAVLGDLHRLLGCWALIFMVPLVLTSAEFLVELLGYGPAYYPGYTLMGEERSALPTGFSGDDLDRAVTVAETTLPGLAVTDAALPTNDRMPIALRGDLTAPLVRSVANSVYLDPVSLTVRGAHRAEDISTGLRLFEAARVVHFGSFAALPGKVVWGIFGVALSTLTALGALIYAERLVFMSERSDSIRQRSRLGHVWAGMGLGKWIGLAVLAFAAFTTLR